ncbi:uncharacterized protein C15orf61 [Arctopsyche grandis]|uniref:uncharacterized protein C15orf61 n=1 Tax=Arctopsyche grandis TaxID=121162 RepID=UPI00406D68CB
MYYSNFLKSIPFMIQRNFSTIKKPTSSQVLTSYIKQCNEPPWTSYFVKYSSVKDDQFGLANFNWEVGNSNYHILRTGCYPYIKYHCSKKIPSDLTLSNTLMRIIKIVNLGIPCLLYGLAAIALIRHEEPVTTPCGVITIYFLLPEDKGSSY